MDRAFRSAGVPAELHVYQEGGHGFGVRDVPLPCSGWKDRGLDWLRAAADPGRRRTLTAHPSSQVGWYASQRDRK